LLRYLHSLFLITRDNSVEADKCAPIHHFRLLGLQGGQTNSTVARLLREAGRGLVAGDFNAVLAEDDTLIQDNGLKDAWVQLHEAEPGFTWHDVKQKFPDGRLNKVALFGLEALNMEVLHPDKITSGESMVIRSDHSGLRCTLTITPS
jgi:tyrosyl-DNA phosphodiesterase 2